MPKEIYLYSPVYDFVAQDLISAMNENTEELTMRVNSPGGSVFANYGICAKMQEHGNVNIKVDGAAMSSAANLLPYAKSVECLDVSTFLLHRADMYVESESDKAFLARINKDLRAKLLARVDAVVFKEVTGFSIDEMFDSEKRIDIMLDAKQAKKIGLVQKINKLTPSEVEAFNSKMLFNIAAYNDNKNQQKQKTMTIDALKSEHPALFAQVVALGVEKEKDRVEACLAFIDVDAKGAIEAINSGKDLSQKQMAEFAVKAMSKKSLTDLAAESNKGIATTEVTETEKDAKAKAIEAFEKGVDSHLKAVK